MKSTGIVRKVDELGRIVLPIELRRTLDINIKDPVEIYVDGDFIMLKKYEPACVFCGSAKDVTEINGKNVKIHKTSLSALTGNEPGAVADNKNVLTVCCGDGKCVDILELQPEGKKRMDIKSYLAGNKIEISTVLGI